LAAIVLPFSAWAAEPADPCWRARWYGRTEEAVACFTKSLNAADAAARAEALWGLGRYQDAVYQFQSAVKARPKDAAVRTRLAELFLERYQPKDAAELFGEAIELDDKNARALLGLARVMAEQWDKRAVDLAEKALEANPQLAEARELLARLAAEDGDFPRALEQAKKALELSTKALDAYGVIAAVDMLEDRDPKPSFEQALKINPAHGQVYNVAGELMVLNRRYHEGIDFFRQAIAIRPGLWEAKARLGINLMRLGEEAEARQHLEACFHNGYAPSSVRNTLTLMDSYKNFRTFKTARATLRLHKKEADLLQPYFESEIARVMKVYDKKYGFEMKSRVQVEVYPDHEDFAVRTMGMPGLGALGVSFGPIVAMDSPSGRKPGSFHWASTLWHEMSHVYALEITKFRVPRWFTEGLAVYEETAISPDWGDRLDAPTVIAIRDKKLLPVEKLDRGFIRPSYPAQVTVSYFQGGRICQFIANNWGYPKLIEMLKDYGSGQKTAEIFPARLGIAPAEFDKRFFAWVESQTAGVVQGFANWQKDLKGTIAAHRATDWEGVIASAPKLRDVFPEYVEAGNPYELLYDAYLAKGDRTAAMNELKRYSKAAGREPRLLKALAQMEEEAGDKKAATATLNRLIYIYPAQDEELHLKLGTLLLDQGDNLAAIREFRAALASKPADPAAAQLALARAYRAANQIENAREALFAALESAPGFRPAQKMLLELTPASKE
jgi:tetratricopeptide (TPR) repeat protein